MEKYNKFFRNITELVEKGIFTSKDLKKEMEDIIKFKVEIFSSGKFIKNLFIIFMAF